MNRHLLLLLLFACSWVSKANMAKPTIDGTSHTCLILTNDCSVTHEKIIAEIIKDDKNSFNDYIIRFRAKYHISSPKEQSMPLLFMASNYLNDQQVFVNGQAISSNSIDQEQDYPFLRKEEIIDTLQYSDGTPTRYNTYTKYYISYDGKEEEEVTPSDLIYFTAPLKAGKNVIEVSYSAFPTTFRYGFLPPYQFEYNLYPSKFWKTFPEIEVEIHFPKELEFEKSSMEEEEYRVSDQFFKGKIKDITYGHHYWRFSPKPSWFGRIVLTINPLGFGAILFLVAAGLHIYTIRKKSKWGLWLGVFLAPLLFYVGFFAAIPFIDWVLGRPSDQGYVFLIAFTYPIFLIFYGIFTFLYYNSQKNKI